MSIRKLISYFGVSTSCAFIALIGIGVFLGTHNLLITLLLIALEITLSFDNAVVNAKVLKNMSAIWQKRFLTWGIFLAVFVTRFILPIAIVSIVAWSSPLYIAHIALFEAQTYAKLLELSKYAIHAFGAAFLLMVALKYFFDTQKEIHWIHNVEKTLSHWGRIEALEIMIVLISTAVISFLVPPEKSSVVLVSGILGVVLFMVMQAITQFFEVNSKEMAQKSIALFIYLEILDASFSLDGVVGAFALTYSIPIIAVGLGIGAFFVRSLTVFMVKEKTLDTLRYLEHGAHWAIFALAISMLISLLFHVSEFVTGSVGILFLITAYYSSLQFRKNNA